MIFQKLVFLVDAMQLWFVHTRKIFTSPSWLSLATSQKKNVHNTAVHVFMFLLALIPFLVSKLYFRNINHTIFSYS